MDNVIATLTITDAAGLSKETTQELIDWLEGQKKTLANDKARNNLAPKFRARYLLTDPRVKATT